MRSLFILSLLLVSVSSYAAGDAVAGKAKFDMLCASCHGATGGGDGVASAALNPKPRVLSDPAFQASKTDDHLKNVIKNGGASVGLSATMPAWGAALTDADIDNVVAFIRSLKK
ncbi:cytochrome c [bacterium]|nr:cytochrome c [bacterium]